MAGTVAHRRPAVERAGSRPVPGGLAVGAPTRRERTPHRPAVTAARRHAGVVDEHRGRRVRRVPEVERQRDFRPTRGRPDPEHQRSPDRATVAARERHAGGVDDIWSRHRRVGHRVAARDHRRATMCVLELGRALAVGRDRVQSSSHILCCHDPRLIIGSIVNVIPGRMIWRVPRVVVVQHLDVAVELLADPVADERPDHAVAVLLGVVLDRPADVAERAARPDGLDAVPHRLLGHPHELAARRRRRRRRRTWRWCRRARRRGRR